MITKSFYNHFTHLDANDFKFYQGLEKEGLRVSSDLTFSMKKHQEALGHKLTHPYITTDYSENLLEFITPVFNETDKLLDFLKDIQKFAFEKIEDELIWPGSFPALIKDENEIPIAYYGESFSGKLKTLYRLGLAHRYGKSMQSIAGLHYNFSFSESLIEKLFKKEGMGLTKQEFQDKTYFKLVRNYRRYSWLLSYLFGATPAVDESFLKDKKHDLTQTGKNTFGLENATSLRMGGLGYTSSAQEHISLCYNELESYITTLEKARLTSYKKYEEIGLKDEDGNFKQLNTNLLQIDNEFYTRIRPKRVASRGESALLALERRGIEYIEVRLLDLNPFEVCGTDKVTLEFLQIFLLFCMMDESNELPKSECNESSNNYDLIVKFGLDDQLLLKKDGLDILTKDYALDVLNKVYSMCDLNESLQAYKYCIQRQINNTNNPSLLLSAQIRKKLHEGESYLDMISSLGISHKKLLLSDDYRVITKEELEKIALNSLIDEKKLNVSNEGTFEDYLKNYFNEIKI